MCIKITYNQSGKIISVQYPCECTVTENSIILFDKGLFSSLSRGKYRMKPDFQELLEPGKNYRAGKLYKNNILAEMISLNPGTVAPEMETPGYEYEINPFVNEMDLFELSPDWPPAGMKEDPKRSGQLIKIEKDKKKNPFMKLITRITG